MGEQTVKRIESRDGRYFVEIIAREDGLCRFVEQTEMTDSGYTFWTPTHWSGLYRDAQSAEREAQAALLWLHDQTSS
jgi:hypothetical protein